MKQILPRERNVKILDWLNNFGEVLQLWLVANGLDAKGHKEVAPAHAIALGITNPSVWIHLLKGTRLITEPRDIYARIAFMMELTGYEKESKLISPVTMPTYEDVKNRVITQVEAAWSEESYERWKRKNLNVVTAQLNSMMLNTKQIEREEDRELKDSVKQDLPEVAEPVIEREETAEEGLEDVKDNETLAITLEESTHKPPDKEEVFAPLTLVTEHIPTQELYAGEVPEFMEEFVTLEEISQQDPKTLPEAERTVEQTLADHVAKKVGERLSAVIVEHLQNRE